MAGSILSAAASAGSVAGLAIGAAAADRLVLIGISYRSTFQVTPKTVQIGGIDAVRVVKGKGTGLVCEAALFYALLPTGATADVDVEFDGVVQGSGVVVLPVYGARPHLASNTGYSKATGGASNGTSINATVDVAAGDLVFALTGALFPNGGTTGVLNLGATTTVSLTGDNQKMYAAAEVQSAAGSRDVVTTFGGSVNYPGTAALVLRPR